MLPDEDVEARIYNQVRFWLENVNRRPAWIALGSKAWDRLILRLSGSLKHTISGSEVTDTNTLFLNILGCRIRVQKEEEVDENDILCIP